MFRQTPFTARSVSDTQNLGRMWRPRRWFRCRVKPLTAGHTPCSVNRALEEPLSLIFTVTWKSWLSIEYFSSFEISLKRFNTVLQRRISLLSKTILML